MTVVPSMTDTTKPGRGGFVANQFAMIRKPAGRDGSLEQNVISFAGDATLTRGGISNIAVGDIEVGVDVGVNVGADVDVNVGVIFGARVAVAVGEGLKKGISVGRPTIIPEPARISAARTAPIQPNAPLLQPLCALLLDIS